MKKPWSPESLRHHLLYSHVQEKEAGSLLPDYLSRRFRRFDREGWCNAVLRGEVSVNGEPANPEIRLKTHDRVDYRADGPEPPAELAFRMVYEDEYLIVFDKPAGLCVHPTGPFFRHTLWHLACARFGELHFVNRLDRETSGLLAAARTSAVAAQLTNGHTPFYREYLALVQGHFQGMLRARGRLLPEPGPGQRRIFRMGEGREGELADTELFFLHPAGENTLVRAVLHTGRRHQIRATLCSLGCPVVGDKLYGPAPRYLQKFHDGLLTPEDWAALQLPHQALHSSYFAFPHPVTGKPVVCRSECPEWGRGGRVMSEE